MIQFKYVICKFLCKFVKGKNFKTGQWGNQIEWIETRVTNQIKIEISLIKYE